MQLEEGSAHTPGGGPGDDGRSDMNFGHPPTFPLRLAAAVIVTVLFAGAPAAPMAHADDSPPPMDESEARDVGETALRKARALIEAKDWQGALAELETAQQALPRNADVYNLMGYANRKLKRYGFALNHYRRALKLDPDHKGALEYLGELYVETGKIDRARDAEKRLARLCPSGCEELDDLRAAIAGKPR